MAITPRHYLDLIHHFVKVCKTVSFLFSPLSFFCPRRNLNSVEDYSSSSVGVVCRVSSVVCRLSSVSNFKHGIISKRFELEG